MTCRNGFPKMAGRQRRDVSSIQCMQVVPGYLPFLGSNLQYLYTVGYSQALTRLRMWRRTGLYRVTLSS